MVGCPPSLVAPAHEVHIVFAISQVLRLLLSRLQGAMCSRGSGLAGIAVFCCLLFAFAVPARSQGTGYTYSVYDFLGSPTDGSMIMGGAIDTQGNVYGNMGYGGANSCSPPYPAAYGCGAIVKWDTTGKETVLHSFAGTDGAMPMGGIVLDGQGNLYGTTYAGGDLTCNSGEGCGTVFKLNLSTLQFTTLHNFAGGTGDGMYSESPLLLDAQGNLYGTTDSGGMYSNGTVFKVDTAGNETVVYSAPSGSEWGAALGALDAQGNLYGTSRGGGAYSEGAVFRISSSDVYTTIYSFTGGSDGGNPRVLKRDALGNLYGNTKSGLLYKLTLLANGTYRFSTVQNFVGAGPGAWPDGTVIDAQGNLYSTTSTGGDLACNAPAGCGTVYKIDTSNNTTVLHTFTGTNGDGTGPSGLLQDVQGNLYGGTGGGLSSCSAPGGNNALVVGCGTAFKLALASSIATTTTTLTSSQSSSIYGQAVTLTADVVASAGTPPNGEAIAFMYGPILLGQGTLSGGTASVTITTLPYGTDSVTAVYPGDPNFAGSQSSAISQQVSQASSSTTLTSSPNPANVAQNVTFTATVTGQYGGIATGSVTFSNGSTSLGTVPLSGGSATLTIPALPLGQGTQLSLGTNSMTAVYSGDANFAGSTSNTESQVVTSVPTGTLEWTWMGGSGTVPTSYGGGQPGAYGTLGSHTAGNYPGSRESAVTWTDSSGNFWLFGGYGWDATKNYQLLNDLWEFSPSSQQWTWIGGSSTGGQPGVYGTVGSPAAGYYPGAREGAVGWTDKSGNFWLFGGYNATAGGYLNDFWMFNPSTKLWTLMGGSSTGGQSGVFGKLGTATAGAFPGNRTNASTWVDSSGNFWLFGGFYYNANNSYGFISDLWEYNPSANQWIWLAGSSTGGQSGVYGTQGTGSTGNTPGARYGAANWIDGSGNLWLFGGLGLDSVGAQWGLNDLWKFSPSTGNWTWMGGQVTGGQAAAYGTLGFPAAANIPGGRSNSNAWTDSNGNFWLFGGLYANDNFSDLWEFSPFTNQWAWMGGSKTVSCGTYGCGLSGVYGTPGTPAPGNNPPGRLQAASWIDSSGNFWLFGGLVEETYGNTSYYAYLNDLWKYQPPPAITPAKPAITLTSSQNPSVTGQSVTFTADATASAGTPPNGETITFMIGSSTLGTGTLTGGIASFTTTALPVGTDTVTAVYAGDGSDGGSTSNAVSQVVNATAVAPAITWATPSAITYGTALSATQLNAASTVAGTFAYTPPAGTVLGAGPQLLSTTFTPTNTTDYTTATASVQLAVNKATSSVTTWPTASSITYGQTLASSTLSGGASTPAGSFTFTSPTTAPGTGTASQSVTFTPTDATDYSTLTGTASVTVNKATSSVTTWPTASSITYGQTLASSTLSGGASTPAGSFAFTTPTTAPGAGTASQSVTFTPTDATDYSTLTGTASVTVNKATPSITWATPAAITYGTALSGTQLNATASVPGAFVYSPAAGTTPAVGNDTLSVTFTPTDATDYTTATASVTLVVNSPSNPVPLIGSMSPGFASAGGTSFTLTVNGTGFVSGSTVYWGTSALATTFGSATQLTAQVPATDIATAGTTAAITVVNPTPGGGTSNSFQFEVNSASGSTTGPTFSSVTQTVTAGSPASYPVTLPSTVESATITCLNLPTGATCSYSATTNTVTITTSSTTPKGTYQITVVFTETVSGAASGLILLPFLLLPLAFLRKQLATRGVWVTACLGLVLLAGAAFSVIGCGGGSSSTPPPQTHQVVSSGTVSLTIQ